MVIDNFHIQSIPSFPLKTDTPLSVDTNTVLPRPIKHSQLSQSNLLDLWGQFPGALPLKDFFSFFIFEILDHVFSV